MWIAIIMIGCVVVLFIGWLAYKKFSGIDDTDIDRISKERSARIDIYSQDMEFELIDVKAGGIMVKCDYAHWLSPNDQRKHWFVEGGVGDKWENIWIEFTPVASGYVLINLRGSFYENVKQHHHDVWVDDVEVEGEGAEMKNGSFEMIDPNNLPDRKGFDPTYPILRRPEPY